MWTVNKQEVNKRGERERERERERKRLRERYLWQQFKAANLSLVLWGICRRLVLITLYSFGRKSVKHAKHWRLNWHLLQSWDTQTFHSPLSFRQTPLEIGWAVLAQIQDGGERVIAYASCAFHASECNYPAHKLKFMALKWVVTGKFHDYLYGRHFQAYTDNNLLVYVMTSAKFDCHSQRWAAVFLWLLHYVPLASGVSIYAPQAWVYMIDKLDVMG